MRLVDVEVQGFRSLADVGPVAVGSPTILAGHNDSGKSAFLDGTAFLLGDFSPTAEDATYLSPLAEVAGADERARAATIEVVGTFQLSAAEQQDLQLPASIRVRRIWTDGQPVVLEVERSVPEDQRFRNLHTKLLPELKELAKDLSLRVQSNAPKATWLQSLEEFASELPMELAGMLQAALSWQRSRGSSASASLTRRKRRWIRFLPAGIGNISRTTSSAGK